MGAGPWTFYYNMRKVLGQGGIALNSNVFNMLLFTESSNAADLTRVNAVELSGEVAGVHGYVTGGQALANVTWAVSDTPDEYRFSADTALWTATGGDIVDVRWAVIARADGLLICMAELDQAPITVTAGNPIVVQPNIGGIFEMK